MTDNIASNNSSTNLIVGGRNGGAAWDGQLDDLAIWNSVLSSDDITDLAGGTSGRTLDAQAYWDFEDDISGTTAQMTGIGGLGATDLTGIESAVPEPSSFALLLLGATSLLRRKRA